MAEHYTGLVRKGMTMSKSSPSLAAAFNLREHSQSRKKLPIERPDSQPSLTLEEIDRLGGNGRWRQRKAEEYFKQKAIEELERQREQREIEERRRKRRCEIEARRRRQQQEEEQKREAERERQRKDRELKEALRQKEEELDRRRQEADQRDWEARQPYTCESCSGSGKCQRCDGKGEVFALFLVSQVEKGSGTGLGRTRIAEVDNSTKVGFGRTAQGCEDCGGCRQNILGELNTGSGNCPGCNGKGKVWPKAAFELKPSRSRFTRCLSGINGDFSPKSSLSSPKAPGMGFGM
mmetsp:Transcript_88570/g.246517  ORF Transcript_88570/g.246517 Transcript_88570/m.246517 type:complete len:292 (+) Transcript_88570:3-878(+)